MAEEENKEVKAQVFDMFSWANYEDLMRTLSKANAVARMDIFDLPQLTEHYYSVDNNESATVLTNTLLEATRSESWRVRRYGTTPRIVLDDNKKTVTFADQVNNKIITLRDIKGYIVIADLQMIIIVPGDESIKAGDFRPNEVIRLTHLLLHTTLFVKLKNEPVKDENGEIIPGKYILKYEMNPIARQ